MKRAVVATLAALVLVGGIAGAQAQSNAKAKPINPLNPPGQANTPSGFHLLQRPSNDAHHPGMDPARKRKGSVVKEPRLKGLLNDEKKPSLY